MTAMSPSGLKESGGKRLTSLIGNPRCIRNMLKRMREKIF